MKTEEQALKDVEQDFDARINAQRATINAEQNALVNLQAQRTAALTRVRRFFAAVADKTRADPIVADPPAEVQDDPR